MMDKLDGLRSNRVRLVNIHRLVLKDLMKRLLVAALTASALLVGSQSARANFVTYDTTGSWNGHDFEASFGAGNSNTATYGQTFVGPSGQISYLRDFSFHIKPSTGVHLQMAAYVFAWTTPLTGHGGHVTGSALYTSPTIKLDGNGSFQTVTFNPEGAAKFNPGSNYVAFLTVSNTADYNASTANGTSTWGFVALPSPGVSPHPAGNGGGGFVYDINGSNFSSLTSTWTTVNDFGDLVWTAEFQAVPEPSALALSTLAAGTLGTVAMSRRRRQLPIARRER
jgi:hypothetical protein